MSLVSKIKAILRPLRNYVLTADVMRKLSVHQDSHGRSAILIATPTHGNLGDQAIVFSQREFLANNYPELAIFEITRFQYEISCEKIAGLVRPHDLIVIDGGGNVGTLWPEENNKMNDIVQRFSENTVVIFPQTAYFSDDEAGRECERLTAEAYAANPRLVFLSRDKATYSKINEIAPRTFNLFVPDIVLYHDATSSLERSGALLCLRSDKERTLGDTASSVIEAALVKRGLSVKETTTVVSSPKKIDENNRAEVLSSKWTEWGSAELVITDRLHGMVFSAITGTPCVALDNVSHKVAQGYEWICAIANIKIANNIEEVPMLVDEVLSVGSLSYDRVLLAPYYNAIKEVIDHAID